MTSPATAPTVVRLQQTFRVGAPVLIAPLDTVNTGDPVLDARLALAVILVQHAHLNRSGRGYIYEALGADDEPILGEDDPVVMRLAAELKAHGREPYGEDAQRAALAAAGL